jgi:hypothetical protein
MSSVNLQAENIRFTSPEQSTQLVELYTSQGCSSCPPAERWISNFKHDKRLWKSIFPLAFHVDYWDYIGWKDEFAMPEYSSRQQVYNRQGHLNQIATPGFVVSGKGWNGWYRGQRLSGAQDIPGEGELKLDISGGKVEVSYLSDLVSNRSASFRVNIAVLGFDLLSNIDAGENRGKDLYQDFVVLALDRGFLLSSKNHIDGKENWTAIKKLPSIALNEQTTKALVSWISLGNDPRPIQVAGGWL